MEYLSKSVNKLINELMKLPTIGPKTAQRLAFYLLKAPQKDNESLANVLIEVKKNVRECSRCFNLTEEDICFICNNSQRDHTQICVAATPQDVSALERTREYKGIYHVLGGTISPLEGIGPDQLKIKELLDRLDSRKDIKEVILALSPNLTGEATGLYLSKLIGPKQIKVTRLALGLPLGADLEYADEVTLSRALDGRQTV